MFVGWFAALLVAASPQLAPGPIPASGKWSVDYEPTYCEAHRQFADRDATLLLTIRTGPTQTAQVILDTPQSASQRSSMTRGKGGLRLEDSNGRINATFLGHSHDGRRETTFEIGDRTQLTAVLATETVGFDGDNIKRRLRLNGLPAVMQALAACERDLVTSWGGDPSSLTAAAVFPRPKGMGPAAWFGADAYPADALATKAQGISILSLTIDPTGRVVACNIIKSSGSAALDRASCKPMLGHGPSFDPAANGAGEAITAQFIIPVAWTAPENSSKTEVDASFGVIITSR